MRDRPQGWPVPPAAQPAKQLAAAHATFVGVIAASTALQRPLGLTTATRLLGLRVAPALCGLAAVGGASVAAVRAASAVADRAAGDDAAAWRRRRARCAEPGLCAAGAALFAAGGGRFWAVSPSCLTSLGAFARPARGSLPATLEYASKSERGAIQALGRRFGCHSCGKWARTSFVADHMPPLSEVRVANRALWRRLLRRPVAQRFYPQCTSCSALQSVAAGAASAGRALPAAQRAVLHAPALRAPATYAGVALVATLLAAEAGSRAAALALQTADDAGAAAARLSRRVLGRLESSDN
jgi:hypothetical protein